jgi:Xaa-Pro aminopeptidase
MAEIPERGFPEEEFRARTAGAQALMAEQGLAALLLTTEPDVRYFTGYLTQFWQSPTRPWFLVIPARGKPIAVIPTIGVDCMARTWVEDIRTWSSPNPEDEGLSLLSACLREVAGEGEARIGLPMGPETHLRMPLADYARLLESLPGKQMTDAAAIVRSLRMVKSEREIAKIAHVCGLVSAVFGELPEILSPGMSEIEIFRAFKLACLERGVDDVSYLVGGAGAGGYGDIISPPGERRVGAGDVLILDTGCLFDGYFCDFDRNYAFVEAPREAARAYEVVHEATEAGLAAAKAGASCRDLFEAMNGVMERAYPAAGGEGNQVGRLGHGLGTQLTEWPSNTAWDETELKPGMVMTLEPGLSFAPGKVMVHEENLVIREEGPQLLTRRAAPRLPVIS